MFTRLIIHQVHVFIKSNIHNKYVESTVDQQQKLKMFLVTWNLVVVASRVP